MPERPLRWPVVAVAAAILVLGGGLWAVLSGDERSEREAAPQPPEATPYYLNLRLGQVKAFPLAGRVRKQRLQEPAETVRQTMASLYQVGFVDPGQWAGGRFPGLFDLFAGKARQEARRDLDQLTVGPAATRLTEVRPEQALLRLRFLLDARRRPVTALANMEFAATGVAQDQEIPIRHAGEYVLRPHDGRWLIVGYEVRGRLGGGP